MPLRTPLSETDHISGNKHAVITLLEYGDYQCPYCWRAHTLVKRLQEHLGDKLQFAFRNFPLTKVHPYAKIAAIAAEAAALQNKYWEMHNFLFEHHKTINYEDLTAYAGQLGINKEQLAADMLRPELEEKVESQFLDGIRSGVNATPTFFINGEKFEGDWDGNNLLEAIWTGGLL